MILSPRLAASGLVALALACAPAWAQRTPVFQSGVLTTPGGIAKFYSNGLIGDGSGLLGDVNGRGLTPFSITDSLGLGVCSNSGLTGVAYWAFCLGHDSTGNALLTVDAYGGAADKSLFVRKNGTLYEFPFTLSGILGPGTTVAGNAAAWNNTTGSLLRDEGAPPGLVVATNAALKLTPGIAGRRVTRSGFTTAGDGGGNIPYTWSASNCSAADDGKQVQPSATGCWIADFAGLKPTPKVWGAVGNGTTNDRAAVQAAITAQAGSTLYLGPYKYGLSSGVSCAAPTRIVGEGRGSVDAIYSGFVQLAANFTVLTGCSDSYFGQFGIELAAAAGVNTSGAAIFTAAGTSDSFFEQIWIDKPCIGIDINGNSHFIDAVYITRFRGSGCGGIRVGNLTTTGATVDLRITRSTVTSDFIAAPDRGDYSLLVKDAGGLFLDNNDFLFGKTGTNISPGNGQIVQWMFANNSALGDTTVDQPLVIDTSHAAGIVKGLSFNNTWTASSAASHGIEIKNVAGGTVSGVHFVGHRSYANYAKGASVLAGSDVTFDAVQFCHNALGAADVGIAWAAGVSGGAIRNSQIKADCDGFGTNVNFQNAVHYIGTNANMILMGNDLAGSGGPVLGLPINQSMVQANRGLDDTAPATITAAASINPFLYPYIIVTGATPVTTIQGCWRGRRIKVRPATALQFNTGGNIAYAYTATINIPVEAICDETSPAVFQWIFGG